MHIAFLIRSLSPGGAERAATSLANEMVRIGHTVTILCMTGGETFYETDESVMIRYLNMDSIENESGVRRINALLRRSRELHKITAELQPDILVGMSWMMSVYAALCTRGTGAVSVGTERSNPFILNDNRINTALRKFAARRCVGFICQSEKARSFFPKRIQKKIRIIQNGIFNPEVFNTSVPNIREKTITALGRLDQNKGYDVLLDAFASVHQKHPQYALCIYGEGELRQALQDRADALRLSQAVHFCGVDPMAIHKVAASSVFVLSSRSEGMPNALIEAMAAGVPCVSTCCEIGPRELIEDGVNGLLVPVDDVEALSRAVCRIIEDTALSESLSQAALELRQTLDPAVKAAEWIDYFATLLG